MKFEKINKNALIVMYSENERYALPIFAVVVSLVLFFAFIVPQVFSFPARKTEIEVENIKLNKIKEAEKIIASTDVDEVESNLGLAMNTLPNEKPFEEAMNGITAAAIESNTQIESYKFQDELSVNETSGKLPSLKFEITIVGGIDQAVEFVNQLYKTYPLSEVDDIESSNTSSVIKVSFFYKSLPINDSMDRASLRETTIAEISLINEISGWNSGRSISISEDTGEIATESASPGSPF